MRPISSTYNSFNSLSRIAISLILTVFISAGCQKSSERTGGSRATGKGNGGNGLKVSDTNIHVVFKNLKPNLRKIFEALSYLGEAERIAPGSTALYKDQDITQTIWAMFQNSPNVIGDLETDGNIHLQESPCKDFRGTPHAAAAGAGEVGGKICFSLQMLRQFTMRNFDNATEILILGLAAHEFVHHYVSTGNHEADEKAAKRLQNFVERQLIYHNAVSEDGIVSLEDHAYLDAFVRTSKNLLNSVQAVGGAQL